jgi:hypothetical protein
MHSKVVGLDLSITSTGICHPNGTTRRVRPKRTDGDERFRTIRAAVLNDAFGCDLAVIEAAPPGLRGAADAIYGVQSVVRVLLMDHGVPYVPVNVATLKAFVTGNGKSDKPAMAVEAYKRAGAEFPGDEGGDMCDAWWLRVIGLYLLGEPPFPMPADRVERLSGLVLPDACRTAVAKAAA